MADPEPSIDRRRDDPDDYGRLSARLRQRNGLPSKRKLSPAQRRARRRRSRCRNARNQVARLLGRPAGRFDQLGAGRESERSTSKLPPRSGERSSSTRPELLVPSVRRRPARTIKPRSPSLGDVMTEEETDRHLEEVRQGAEVGDRRDGQAAFDLAHPARSTEAQLPPRRKVRRRALRKARRSPASSWSAPSPPAHALSRVEDIRSDPRENFLSFFTKAEFR